MPAASPRFRALAPAALAAALALVYLIWAPASQDLAAATFRADLFADHGFLIWNNDWYSGHYLLSYSVLYPPLGALLGPRLVGAVSVVAAAALFALLARRRFGDAAFVPSLWLAAAVASWLFTGRMPYLLALPFGLAALLALDLRRTVLATGLAVLCALASPVAGLFLALAATALAVADAGRRWPAVCVALGAAVPIGALTLAFPVGGEEPFVFSAFIAVPLLAAVVLWLVPARYRALRLGAVLYAALAVILLLVPNALGGNVTRLGALFAGPVLALVLWPRGRLVVIAVAIPLIYWQLVAPVRDVRKALDDPSTEPSFYTPLVQELDRVAGTGQAVRVEVPPTRNRFEAVYVAPSHPIARGWLRQLESDDFDLFTGGNLTPGAYRGWLDAHEVAYVAVPNADLDYLAEDEVVLVDSGLDYLEPVWKTHDWRLYRVRDPVELGPTASGTDWFELDAPRAGAYHVGINFNGAWTVSEGDACVEEAPDGGTEVHAAAPGTIRVEARLTGGSCSG